MKYKEVCGSGDLVITFTMKCSRCGESLGGFNDLIDKRNLKFCPFCGWRLAHRCRSISKEKIVEMLNGEYSTEETDAN